MSAQISQGKAQGGLEACASIAAAVEAQLQARPEALCLVFIQGDGQTQEMNTTALRAAIHASARALQANGVGSGDLVALAYNHTWELVAAFLGAIHLGAVPVILPYLDTISSDALKRQTLELVTAWRVQAVITLPQYRPLLGFLENAGNTKLSLLAPGVSDDTLLPASERYGEETAYLQLSSGTTGQPKATIIPHRALLNSVKSMLDDWSMTPQDVGVGWLPLHHDMGLIMEVLMPLLGGFPSVLIAPDYWVRRPRSLLQAVHRYRGTFTSMPNFAFNHCARSIRPGDLTGLELSSWRLVLNGAEIVYPESLQLFYQCFAAYGLRRSALRAVYGMTENVGAASVTPPAADESWWSDWVAPRELVEQGVARPLPADDPVRRAVVSCGRPLPGNEFKVAADDGRELPDRQMGEILLRSRSLCPAYYRPPDGTPPLPGEIIPRQEGWFPTGDLGYLAAGELFICDRKKDLIISAGNHIFPGVIEKVGLEVMGERAGGMAAFGVTDRELGTDLPVLICEVRGRFDEPERSAWAAEILRRVYAELGLSLADIRFVRRGWLVQTTSAKIIRAACRDKYLAEFSLPGSIAGQQAARPRTARPALPAPFAPPRTELEMQLAVMWADLLGLEAVGVDDNFFELGGDSLLALRLGLLVEQRWSMSLPAQFYAVPTVAALARLLSGEAPAAPVRPSLAGQAAGAAAARPGWQPPLTGRSSAGPAALLRRLEVQKGPIYHGLALPYALGVRLQRAWLRRPAVRRWISAEQTLIVERCLAEAGLAAPWDDALTLNFMINTWIAWRKHELQSKAVFERWVTLRNGELLADALRQGRGLIVVFTHQASFSSLAREALRAYGHEQLHVLTGKGWQSTGLSREGQRAYNANQALKILQEGGVVLVAGDGRRGSNPVTLPFYGRLLPLPRGFAELALHSRAAVVAGFLSLALDGRAGLDFTRLPTPTTPAEADDLFQRYAGLMTARWPQLLPTAGWGRLAYIQSLPTRAAGQE